VRLTGIRPIPACRPPAALGCTPQYAGRMSCGRETCLSPLEPRDGCRHRGEIPDDLRQVGRRTPNTGGTGSAVLDSIAAGLEIDADKVRRVFAKNGEPELIMKSGKLPRTRAAAAADIAMLVMAGVRSLRESCRRYGKFDQGNFGKHMRSLDNYIITDGRGVSARRKLTHPGIEAAAELVD